jgi:4-carboxymuconolactone decarboxylase
MTRIPYFDLAQAMPELQKAVGSRPPLNIYRMLAHGGPSAVGFLKLGNALLTKSQLDPVLRELVILRVGILSRADYEVHQHTRIAKRVGVSEEKIAALYDGAEAAIFTDIERKILRYTDQVVLNVKAGDSTFAAVAALLSHQELVELTLTIGFYMLVSRFLENFEVEIEQPAGATA